VSVTRKQFAENLKDLHHDLLKMGTLVEETIRKSVAAITTRNSALARQVMQDEEEINSFETEIQDRCIILLATEQPVAHDLRSIVTAIKIATQLERIGDHAVHLAKSALRLADRRMEEQLIEVPRMAEICICMFHDILTALVENSEEKAMEVAGRDDDADMLYTRISEQLLARMCDDKAAVTRGIELLFVSRYLERIGDHVTNIAELIVYNASGRHVELNR
jgi:phosphate transport system protein